MKDIEAYFVAFEKFIKIISILGNRYTADNDIAFVEEDFLVQFLADSQITSFSELFFEISQADVNNACTLKKNKT